MKTSPYMIVIAGSTGVGKSDLAIQLGSYAPIEIINADLGQFYQPLSIGTAKPLWQESSIKHHLFDIFSTPRSCTIAEYRSQLLSCLNDVWSRNKIPVIVGGSTFYLESIFFQPASCAVPSPEIPQAIVSLEKSDLWKRLHEIDPERAAVIHPHDYYRLERGLMLWNATGIKPSDQKPFYNPPASFLFLYVTRDRDDLYKRINQRVIQMIDNGWIEEVRTLINTPWQKFIETKKFIGYPELIHYITQESSFSKYTAQSLIDIIAQKTRNYAKRQETYWKRLEKKLSNCLVTSHEYTNNQRSKVVVSNITSLNFDNYSKQLCEQLYNVINDESSMP